MERGKLSEIQRDEAWRAQDPADRTAMSALANLNPDEESPEQIAFRKRLEKIKDDDANFAMSNDPDMAANTGRQMTGAGAARAAVAASEQDQRKKDKEAADRAELLAMLEALDQRIAELGEIIGRLDNGHLFRMSRHPPRSQPHLSRGGRMLLLLRHCGQRYRQSKDMRRNTFHRRLVYMAPAF